MHEKHKQDNIFDTNLPKVKIHQCTISENLKFKLTLNLYFEAFSLHSYLAHLKMSVLMSVLAENTCNQYLGMQRSGTPIKHSCVSTMITGEVKEKGARVIRKHSINSD